MFGVEIEVSEQSQKIAACFVELVQKAPDRDVAVRFIAVAVEVFKKELDNGDATAEHLANCLEELRAQFVHHQSKMSASAAKAGDLAAVNEALRRELANSNERLAANARLFDSMRADFDKLSTMLDALQSRGDKSNG